MKKQWLTLCALVLGLQVGASALENFELGVRVGGEVTLSGIGFYTELGRYRYDPYSSELDVSFLGFNPNVSIFFDFAITERSVVSLAVNTAFNRNYTVTLREDNLIVGKSQVRYHSFALDLLYKERRPINDYLNYYSSLGLGVSLNTVPRYKSDFIDGSTTKGDIDFGKMHLGVHVVVELGLSVKISQRSYAHLGLRTAYDLMSLTYQKGLPPETDLASATSITPFSFGISLGSSIRF